jgi:hypothetical protein
MSATQAERFKSSASGDLKMQSVLSVEKIKHIASLRPVFSRNIEQKARTVVRASVLYIQQSSIGDFYRNQPLLFMVLALFTSVSLGVLGCIFHLIRNDPRFF